MHDITFEALILRADPENEGGRELNPAQQVGQQMAGPCE